MSSPVPVNPIHHAFLLTMDPLHIGTGSYRLSRVDLPIVREPATNLPKVPGTSLSGAARAHAALLLHGRNGEARCSGQRNHCGKCAVCWTFGSVRREEAAGGTEETEGKRQEPAYAGMVSVFDARLTLFPVASMLGPVWITSVETLAEAQFENLPAEPSEESALVTREWPMGRINLGWMLLETKDTPEVKPTISAGGAWAAIKDRIVIVPNWLFSQLVNMNLEVRTSVSIDPKTGAASEGALFTYEAIPRGAWLHLELGENQYRPLPENGKGWKRPLDVVWSGLELAEQLGLGGMGTRGFGRVRLLGSGPGGGTK